MTYSGVWGASGLAGCAAAPATPSRHHAAAMTSTTSHRGQYEMRGIMYCSTPAYGVVPVVSNLVGHYGVAVVPISDHTGDRLYASRRRSRRSSEAGRFARWLRAETGRARTRMPGRGGRGDGEARALTEGARDGDVTAVRLHNSSDKAQSQPQATRGAVVLPPIQPIPDLG